jgi:hypothetical protein
MENFKFLRGKGRTKYENTIPTYSLRFPRGNVCFINQPTFDLFNVVDSGDYFYEGDHVNYSTITYSVGYMRYNSYEDFINQNVNNYIFVLKIMDDFYNVYDSRNLTELDPRISITVIGKILN